QDNEENTLISELRLAGITQVEQGRLRVRNRIYARVFDRTWIRAHLPGAEWRRQRVAFWRGVAATAVVGGGLLLAGWAGWYWGAYLRSHVAYYANGTEQGGPPEGVGQDTADEAKHRAFTRKVTRHGRYGLVEQVAFVNGYGTCPEAGTPQSMMNGTLALMDQSLPSLAISGGHRSCRIT